MPADQGMSPERDEATAELQAKVEEREAIWLGRLKDADARAERNRARATAAESALAEARAALERVAAEMERRAASNEAKSKLAGRDASGVFSGASLAYSFAAENIRAALARAGGERGPALDVVRARLQWIVGWAQEAKAEMVLANAQRALEALGAGGEVPAAGGVVDAAVAWHAAGPDPEDINAATAALKLAVETYLRKRHATPTAAGGGAPEKCPLNAHCIRKAGHDSPCSPPAPAAPGAGEQRQEEWERTHEYEHRERVESWCFVCGEPRDHPLHAAPAPTPKDPEE